MAEIDGHIVHLAKLVALNVPAYADFLAKHEIDPASISTPEQFAALPITSKKTYLQAYDLKDLVWGGTLAHPMIFCSTSGSTGAPFYFPRSDHLAEQYSHLIQDYLTYGALTGKKPTLVLVAFGMGVWIGGVFTLRAFEIASQRMNYPVSLLPVGYNKTEIFKALRQLAPQFAQTILIGYPPFIKEIIDEAPQEGVDLKKLNMRLLFAAEAFTETYRDYVCERTGANPLLDTLNVYGTADIGAMAYETPLSILIRRLASKDPLLFQDIFGQIEKTPTLAQYNPEYMAFELVDGEVVLTGNSSLPLIRYSVGDHGGVFSFAELEKLLARSGHNLHKEAEKAGIAHTIRRYPFVFVYERVNFAATLHGIVIYPEFIKEALLQPTLVGSLTEKFTMLTKYDVHHNQYLEVNVELQKDIQATEALKELTATVLRETLIRKSSEFAEISRNPASQRLLKIVFWPYGDPKYFQPGIKQRWVVKDS